MEYEPDIMGYALKLSKLWTRHYDTYMDAERNGERNPILYTKAKMARKEYDDFVKFLKSHRLYSRVVRQLH